VATNSVKSLANSAIPIGFVGGVNMGTEIRDRLSFRDFLGLEIADKVPDEKTIWLFAEGQANILWLQESRCSR
jgi:hypothetical protein